MGEDSSVNNGSDRTAAIPAAVKREAVVSFQSQTPQRELDQSERTCSVSEEDSGVVLARTDQSESPAHTAPTPEQTRSQSPAVTVVRPVSADLSHEGFPQTVQVL